MCPRGRLQPALLFFLVLGLPFGSNGSEFAISDSEDGELAMFPRPSWQRCEALGAYACASDGGSSSDVRSEFCCCPEARPCRRKQQRWGLVQGSEWGCARCPGSFVRWRDREGFAAERYIAGLMLAPRSTITLQALLRVWEDPRWLTEDADADGLSTSAVVWWSALAIAPQLLEFDRVVAFAEDSFWWALGVAHALTGHLLSEAGLLLRLLLVLLGLHGRAGRRVALQELLLFAHSGALALGFVAAAGACAALPGIGPQLQHGAVTALLFYRAFEAVVAPLWWLRSQRLPMAMLNLLVVLGLLSQSRNIGFDTLTTICLLGPGAKLGCRLVLHFFAAECVSVVIERYRFLESSVEQLRLLGPRQLRYPPNVVYISEHADDADEDSLPSITRELGLDFGGLCRDWLNEVAMGLVSREQGLVEHGLVDGTAFARLKPGGDPQQLEALGKVLGLALRDSQPLGIEMCAPLCHLLTHPRLPTALESIRNIPDTAAARGDIGQPSPSVPAAQTAGFTGRSFELQRLGFSAEWLRWVSQEEYDFWRAMGQTAPFSREALQDVEYSGPPSAEGVRQHMEKKALSSLILDVSPELTALWRGLRAVPDLTLPSLAVEVRGAKRGPPEIPEPSEGPRAKRRRLADRSPLQEMISGGVDVPVTKWQQFTRYSPNKVEQLPAGLRTMRWFWDYVANLSGEERSALLQWITGYRRIPPGGFPAPVPFMTLHLTDASPQRLPTAHTCGLQLDLPRNYGTYDELRIRLSDASRCRQFFIA